MQIIQESNIEKLINKVEREIYDAATLGEEAIYLNQPYFKKDQNPNIPYDPYHQGIKKFDYDYVFNDMRRFVTYHIHKTLGITSDHPYGQNDPMVAPIAKRLTNAFYKDALDAGFVLTISHKQSWYSGSVIKYHLDESIDWSDKKGNKYHRNGMVNRIVGDFLKMIELDGYSVKFHLTQHMESPQRTHNDPYLTYIYDENGLTQESKDVLYEGLTNGIQWYMEHTGLIDYYPPHSTNNARPPEDVELIKMIADTLHPLIVKAVTDYNEDEDWTKDTLYDSKFLAESLGNFKNRSKQEQYVNYVLKHIMDNTKWADASYSQLLLNDRISMSTYINYGDFEFSWVPDDVRTVLKEMGLNAEELSDVWDIYSSWVLEKIMREGNVNWPNREFHKKRYPHILRFRLTESTSNTTKFAQNIADEITNLITLTGELMHFHTRQIGDVYSPVAADVEQEWNYNDDSTDIYNIKAELGGLVRRYLIYELKLGLKYDDPLYAQISLLVYDNILYRLRNYDKEKENAHLLDLLKKDLIVGEITESTIDIDRVLDNSSRFAKKLAKEIIDSSVLSGKLLNFYPPVVEEDKYEGPISADVNSEWIHNDRSTGVYHLTDDIRRVGRNYINNILQLGLDRNDPLFSQVNNIVIDNILQRARNHNWMKEVGGMRDLKDGIISESTQPNYLDKIFNSLIKELEFGSGTYNAVIIPFINSERYSSTTGELEMDEYRLPHHDRNIRLRDDGVLHREFRSYLHEIYGLSIEEADEVFGMVRQYIKSELYYKSVLKQILSDVQDDYIQGYGAKVDVTPERTIDLKNYDDFKEYVDWWHGIVEPDYDNDGVADVSDNMVKRLYDEIWGILKDNITLAEGWPADPDVEIIDGGEFEKEHLDRRFPDKFYLKIFKMIDKDPEYFMREVLENLGFDADEEYDILYNYFVNYSDRKDYYVDFTIDPQDIASFFQDRDYGMEEIVKNYLEGNWEYLDWYNESFPYDTYMLDSINDANWKEIATILKVDNVADAEELLRGNIHTGKLEDHYELMEDTIGDTQHIIARSITEAQADADMSYLHEDILNEVNDFFKHGKFDMSEGEFIGSVELGDVFVEKGVGLDLLSNDLQEGYPILNDMVDEALHEELNDWGYSDTFIFTGVDKPNINTDKHFRYGGAGTMDEIHFNDMLADRLSWDY